MKTLACHADAYQRQLATTVLACAPAPDGEGFRVALAESVLYPGGGGQPEDHGTIGAAQVTGAIVEGDAVWYRVDRAVEPGPIETAVDWPRRFDHMQQHTAQHLLTAVAMDRFGLSTLAFHLNPERCDVVLDGVPDDATLSALEDAVNAEIRAARPVRARSIDPERLAAEGVRSRLLPPGHEGSLRVVEIDGIDLNTCGGTHVANTAELQMLRIIGCDVQKGQARVHFLAGDRVRRAGAEGGRRAAALTHLLKRGPAEHVEAVGQALAEAKALRKAMRGVNGELAGLLGAQLATGDAPVAIVHRDAADMGFLGTVAKAAHKARPDLLLFLTGGAPEGVFLLAGPADRVSALGPKIAEIIAGRGGGRGGRFQGKATRLDRRAEAAALIEG